MNSKLDKKRDKEAKKLAAKIEKNKELTADKQAKASKISIERLLGDDDFKRIDAELVRQQVTNFKRGTKRRYEEEDPNRGELVKLADIENIYKKRKHDKQARIDSIKVRFIYLLCLNKNSIQF